MNPEKCWDPMQTFYRTRKFEAVEVSADGIVRMLGPTFLKIRLPVVCTAVLLSLAALAGISSGSGIVLILATWVISPMAIIWIAVTVRKRPLAALIGVLVLTACFLDDVGGIFPAVALFLQGPLLVYLFIVKSRRGSIVMGAAILLLLAAEVIAFYKFLRGSGSPAGAEPGAFIFLTLVLTLFHYLTAFVAVGIDRVFRSRASGIRPAS